MLDTTPMESIAPGDPFHSDSYRMGQYVGTNVCIMFERHEEQPYIVVVNTATGERVRCQFTNERTLG